MLESIIAEIDAEIARLQTAKALLSSESGVGTIRKLGRPAVAPVKAPTSRKLSAEARERIRQAQIKRWAKVKKMGKPNVNAAVAPLPTPKKKAGKSAA